MKKLGIYASIFLSILLLTKIANQMPIEPPAGTSFSLKAQKVVQCSPSEITLVDNHHVLTHLDKDESWPACSDLLPDTAFDFYLSRGERTHFLSDESTVWWRKAL
jgi:hypothetical protein